MFLKKIELTGFKSFAEKTEIIVENGITAIVGPNGSGKSNISDAVKWVLGEQSAKSLRGTKMEDVIFAGTEKRMPVGYAEVNLVFDNKFGNLPIEYNEVSIKRRLFRTGESEYSINKKLCKLKDIKELFMDTGIGKDGYSVIGQGRVEDILSTKSEIRRNVFEEAAGIVKYKTRKEESIRKLEKTTNNIERVNDIIHELKQRIEPLKNQSVKAKEYLRYKSDLKKLEINFLVREYEKYKLQVEQLDSQKKEVVKVKDTIYKKRDDGESKVLAKKEKIKEIEDLLTDSENNKNKILKEYEGAINNIEIHKQKIDLLNTNSKNINSEVNEYEKRKIELEKEIENIVLSREKLIKNLENEKLKMEQHNEKFNEHKNMFDDSTKKIELEKEKLYELYNNLNENNNKKNTLESLKKNIEDRLGQLDSEIISVKSEVEEKQSRNNELCNEKNKINNNIKRLTSLYKDTKQELITLETKKKSLELTYSNMSKVLNSVTTKLNVLNNMELYYDGYYRSVQKLMKEFKNNNLFENRIIGTTADLIKTNKEYEIAIETALGNSIQNIIVRNEEDTEKLIQYLKSNKIGRVTFLPLTTVKGRSLRHDEEKILKAEGVIGTADKLVENVKEYDNVIKYLLGRILIVDNIKNGFKVAKKLGYTIRIVSLDGEVINPGGAVTGGYINKKSQNILSRKRQLEELKVEKISITKKTGKLKNEIDTLSSKIIKLVNDTNAIIKEQNEENQAITAVITKIKFNEEEIIKTNNRIVKYEEEKKYLIEETNIYLVKIEDIEKEILNKKDVIISTENSLKEVSNISDKNKDEYEKINNIIKDIKIQTTSMKQRIMLLEEKEKNNKNEIYRTNQAIDIKKNNINDIEKEIIQSQEQINQQSQSSKTLSRELDLIKAKYNNYKKEKNDIQADIYKNQDIINEINKRITNILDDENLINVKIERYKTKTEEISSRLWDDYEMNYAMALEFKDESISYTKVSREVSSLKKNIKQLGDVNVNSIEEYKEIKERYEFLLSQRTDLLNAEIELKKVIKELENNMKEKFIKEFKNIKIKFNEVFKNLFYGGKADVYLENEDDALNSNIEIVAQPPGKKLNKITLLSGGEKALTAIALLFAILKTKPTPFCILDEIEAALDDANVYKFAKFLQEYSKETQFLVITHRKGTMEYVDTLYGTTMEEKGVTKLVSIKLSDIEFDNK